MIFICQYLCPDRHCIMAMCYDLSVTEESAEQSLKETLTALGVNSWCGICGSADLRFEHRVTRFATMQEAAPHLSASQADNIASRKFMDSLGTTHDVKQNAKN